MQPRRRYVADDTSFANAQDPDQSFQDVADAFQSLGYPVSLYTWSNLNEIRISVARRQRELSLH